MPPTQKENENPEGLEIMRMEIKKFAALQYPGKVILHIISPSVIHKVTNVMIYSVMSFNCQLSLSLFEILI